MEFIARVEIANRDIQDVYIYIYIYFREQRVQQNTATDAMMVGGGWFLLRSAGIY